MRCACALAALAAVVSCLSGCVMDEPEPVKVQPQFTREELAAAAETAVKELYPRAIVGRVVKVDLVGGSAEIDLGGTDGVRLGMEVRFLAASPVIHRGKGKVFHIVRGKKRAYVNLSADPSGGLESLAVGDLAAVLK